MPIIWFEGFPTQIPLQSLPSTSHNACQPSRQRLKTDENWICKSFNKYIHIHTYTHTNTRAKPPWVWYKMRQNNLSSVKYCCIPMQAIRRNNTLKKTVKYKSHFHWSVVRCNEWYALGHTETARLSKQASFPASISGLPLTLHIVHKAASLSISALWCHMGEEMEKTE